ncbi:hypothetical protein Tco_0981803, partial [Tanacetum coccineum]
IVRVDQYALTINPTIYVSCIKQFWATVKMKTVNGEVQLQVLVDGKKIIITEATVRRDLQLEDAEGIDYLPNANIFEQLTLMVLRLLHGMNLVALWLLYGYIRNHMKTVKNEQAQTRESEEFKKKPKIQSRSQKSQASVKSIFIKGLLSLSQSKATSTMVKAHWNVGFCAKALIKEAQCHPKENDMLAIFRCPQINPTATIEAQMIG